MVYASESEVVGFLKRFKTQASHSEIQFVRRKRCLDDIARLGLSRQDAEDIILGLSVTEYAEGPEEDHDGTPGEIWVFGKETQGQMVYIKLKSDGTNAKCLSFHPADHTMQFPYARKRSPS
jgi:hypothetical protein